ncbi:putative non-specific protein-tyrosine kinase RLK-Pelle-RLCK-XII-2 family [Rosa chinensis]|uniref:Putative non-specific protein-tyrosine kinase RLK-Pelle-RLCK-XII-2 family n=1 Tax=Rosa chinensis TaxID=74649 RepID=A0A2P6PK16_ROSCH|nr:non-functional pseudokinase ZRK2 [Rosa chinensis]XP_024161921.1 non-functional pseudokinase ZRK2 [Rosa chinensis]XP_024161922.1 non-functional pseudokinase ZRK2 [Rosa chinensis]XP_024161925.1 non-functional pseudokinase ZRK2 [Rosa chinensis]XP_040363835.1 non-functional pseudokinase ZRK2 [Rosa chinensis]PRQ22278.1 putative non-specific protein-tyrosine kinase RLK-Pelle-RLCK-XII-2 family [Rosa chinensis]
MLSKLLYSLLPCLRMEEKYALDNGSKLLEDLIASCDGKSNPIRHYSADELVRATNNFHPSCRISGGYDLYKGFLDNRLVMINCVETSTLHERWRDMAIRDIIISMQMSAHKNVLKLLGCCLEFHVPALVHEYAAKGVLNSEGGYGDNESLPWKTRLRIAKQLANAITYLHTAFPRPIIHRNLKPSCIFLDHDFSPKLCDFSRSMTIPPEQSHVIESARSGTVGYLEPAFGYVTEKTDVYSFGAILLVFLSGQIPYQVYQAGEDFDLASYAKLHASDDQFHTIVDPKILEELKGEDEQAQQQQLHDFLALALLCTQFESERRPDMIDVAKELVRIEKSINPC